MNPERQCHHGRQRIEMMLRQFTQIALKIYICCKNSILTTNINGCALPAATGAVTALVLVDFRLAEKPLLSASAVDARNFFDLSKRLRLQPDC
jgi:hypothetical protein